MMLYIYQLSHHSQKVFCVLFALNELQTAHHIRERES
jgi:hypothetical protein